MPRHSLVMVAVTTYAARKKSKAVDATNFDGAGADLLTHFRAAMQEVKDNHPELMTNNSREHFAIIETIEQAGRYVFVEVDGGNYGLPGRVRSVSDGTVELDFDESYASTNRSRFLFVVPNKGTGGILFIERVSGRSSASAALIDVFMKSLRRKFPDLDVTFHNETVVETDAWIAAAQLTRVTGRVYDWSPDAVDKGRAKPVGELMSVYVPPKANGAFDRYIYTGLKSRKIKAATLLGLTQDPDEVSVELESAGRTKTFILDKERTPTVSVLISNHGDERPDDKKFKTEVFDLARDHLERVASEKWTSAQESGAWTKAQLDVNVDVGP